MKHYTVAQIDVTDTAWVRQYVSQVTGMVERAGGRYLARTTAVDKLEGDRPAPQLVLLIEWPDRQAADRFYDSEEYSEHKRRRLAGARNETLVVAGEDVNGIARIAP
jgi:uncharacterized protein (DUF1330 family)